MSGNSGESGREKPSDDTVRFTEAENEVLAYLRNSKRVDLRWLDEAQKQKIRSVLDGLHNERRMSLLRISKEVGRSYLAIWGLCRALEIHTRTVAEAGKESAKLRSKHKRSSFSGTPEKEAYMLGFGNGDLTAWQVSGTAVMVTSTTTHPAFAELFHLLFDEYGHVYEYPMHEKDKGYKWKLAVRLDNSFQFLLFSAETAIARFERDRAVFMCWLAGLLDADGHIYIGVDDNYLRVRIEFGSVNKPVLISVGNALKLFRYHPSGPYLGSSAGFTTPLGITYRSDMWRLEIQRTHEARELLSELPIAHSEKLLRKELALSFSIQSRIDRERIASRLEEIKSEIRDQVRNYIELAHKEYEERKTSKSRSATT